MSIAKPTAEELLDLCNDTVAEYAGRDSAFTELEPYYFIEDQGDGKGQEEGIESVHLPYGSNAIDLIQDLFGDADLSVSVPAAAEGTTAKKLADTCEKYLLSVIEQSERAQKQSVLARAAWLVGMRGCIAGRAMAIQEWLKRDEESNTWEAGQRVPLLLQLRDPLYVFPAFGLDGLAYVVEKRTRKVRDLRNSLGEDVLPNAKLTDDVEWMEYWDDTWFCYWADGEPVNVGAGSGPWPHRYGGMPYAFEFARQTGKTEPEKRVRPLLKSVKPVIDRMALLDSAEATFILDYNGDALIVYSSSETEIDKRSGAINYLEPDDRVDWLRASRQPLELAAAHGKYSAQLQKGTFPDTVYGMDPGRVTSGYTVNLLNQSGQIRLRPMIKAIERLVSGLLENVLMISEHYLTDLIGGAIPFYLTVEREGEEGDRYKSREAQTLDASKLGGWYQVEASLGELMPADEQANLVLALRSREAGPDGRPMLSWETAVDKWGLVSSPADERDRIDREAAWNDPQVVALRQAILAAQIRAELEEELLKLDIDPAEILAGLMAPPGMEQMPPGPEMMPPGGAMPVEGLPPEVLPPQMQGELMPEAAGYTRPRRPGGPGLPGV